MISTFLMQKYLNNFLLLALITVLIQGDPTFLFSFSLYINNTDTGYCLQYKHHPLLFTSNDLELTLYADLESIVLHLL